MNLSRNVFVADTIARSTTDFYFSQLLRKKCETCSFQGMLHLPTIRATCVATKLQGKLQEKLSSVRAPFGLYSQPQKLDPPYMTQALAVVFMASYFNKQLNSPSSSVSLMTIPSGPSPKKEYARTRAL